MSSDSRPDAKQTFARFFEEPREALEPTLPDLPVVKRKRKGALLVDPANSSTTNRRVAVAPEASDLAELKSEPQSALTSTLEVSSREYHQILRAAEALRFEDLSFDGNDPFARDPFAGVDDAPDLQRDLKATLKCPPWDERQDERTAPRPITLAGDVAPSAPAEVTLDDDTELLNLEFRSIEDELNEPFAARPPGPPPMSDDGSSLDGDALDARIREAVDPFGLGGIEVSEDSSGEWTAPELSGPQRLPTRVSEPTETDRERARELYTAALEELALQRKTAALVHARLALGYDPDNGGYKAFVDDLLKMMGAPADLSASGSLPVLDEDIVSWDGRSLG